MNIPSNSNPLSSFAFQERSSVTFSASQPLGNEKWRSEAFAEDLLGESLPAVVQSRSHHRWQGALQCALPLTIAVVAGIVACLQTLA